MRRRHLLICLLSIAAASVLGAQGIFTDWSAEQAESIGKSMYAKGRVGPSSDWRVIATDRSYNYKLAATWMTPEVIRATARLRQVQNRLTDAETLKLVEEAEAIKGTVVMVEIDPREGSGVIPLDWQAFLQPRRSGKAPAARGVNTATLRDVQALSGVIRRDYAYDRFWVVFPLTNVDGTPLFEAADTEAELVVRIHNMEGRVTWRIPQSIRRVVTAE